MKTIRVPMTANQKVTVHEYGTFVKLVSATGAVRMRAEQKAKAGGSYVALSEELELAQGDRPKFKAPFDSLTFTDLSGGANTLVLIVGEGDHEADSVVGSVSISNAAPATYDSSPDITLVTGSHQDYAADATSREYIFEAAETNTAALVIRDQSATTDEGKRLKPGETVVINTKGALRVRNNTGVNQTFYLAQTKS